MKKLFLIFIFTLSLLVVSACTKYDQMIKLSNLSEIATEKNNELIDKIYKLDSLEPGSAYEFFYDLNYRHRLGNHLHTTQYKRTSLISYYGEKEKIVASTTEKLNYKLTKVADNDLVIDLSVSAKGYLDNNIAYFTASGKERRYNGVKNKPLFLGTSNETNNFNTELSLHINKELTRSVYRSFRSYHGRFFTDKKNNIVLEMDAKHLFTPISVLPQTVFNAASNFKIYYIFDNNITELIACECIITNAKFESKASDTYNFSLVFQIKKTTKKPLTLEQIEKDKYSPSNFNTIFKYLPEQN